MGTLDFVMSLRDDVSPHALWPADTEAFGAPATALTGAVARSGADSTNQQDARCYGGYWTRFYTAHDTSRLRDGAAANTDTDARGHQHEVHRTPLNHPLLSTDLSVSLPCSLLGFCRFLVW